MDSKSLFRFLETANEKPAVYSKYTASELWADEYTSARMLDYHLNGDIDVSSRRSAFIEASVRWMVEHFELSERARVADFGCGPGLYSSRLAQHQIDVVGVDFSPRSIAYAREYAQAHGLEVTYVEADYLEFQPDGKFDLIIMIMWDFCALSPDQRAVLLAKFKTLLAPGGRVLLDVYSLNEFAEKQEAAFYEENQLNGLWAEAAYYAFVRSFRYEAEQVSLDKYTIVEADRQRMIYNWLQYFTPETLRQEVRSVGLDVDELFGDVSGSPYDAQSKEFAVVLKCIEST